MAIYVLRKNLRNKLENNFLLKVIEGISIFQKNPELLIAENLN